MTGNEKRKALFLISMVSVIIMVLAISLPTLELKPGIPLPQVENNEVLVEPMADLPFVAISLGAAGILTGSPAWLCLAGDGFSLAVWDLSLFNQAMQGIPSSDQCRSYEIQHLQSLGLAVGLGIFVGIFGRTLHLQTLFVLIVIFIAQILFGLNRIWDYYKR